MITRWTRLRETRTSRYAIAVALVAAAVLLRLLLINVVGLRIESPFLLMFAAIVLSSIYGGFGPAIIAAALGALASDYFFLPPPHHFAFVNSEDRAQVGLFFLEGVVLSLLGAMLRRERQRAEQADAAARQLEQKFLQISEDDRRRFGHDLHDGLGQHLTGIALLSKALRQRLALLRLPEADQAAQIAELVNESIGWTRDLARGLTPVTIEADGLPAALDELTTSASKRLSIRVTCACDGEINLPGETLLHLYRVAQEAINNSVKHGKAKTVSLDLIGRSDRVELTILDDGNGLSAQTRAHPGVGLQIMQYRAKMIGATLSLERISARGGTRVRCIVPAGVAHKEHQTS